MQNLKKIAAIAVPIALLAGTTTAHADSLTASIRIGASLVDDDSLDNDIRVQNFGSRLKWSGETELENGLTGIAYVELGINPDNNQRGSSGIDRTRFAWAGLKGGFGSVKIGAQYAAFYDHVSGTQDIAWWGSCWTQFECSREVNVLKYSGSTGPVSYTASIEADPGDDDNDVADDFELGAGFAAGPVNVGVATSIRADEGDDEGGTLVGAVVTGSFAGLGLGLGVQVADEDFANAVDDVTHVTFTASYRNFYLVTNATDGFANDSGGFSTLGYTLNIGAGTLMYFEAQTVDQGDGASDQTILRATYKYDFGVL